MLNAVEGYYNGNQIIMDECGIVLTPIGRTIAEKAAQIRAEYKDFKAMDSIQLASAICSGCDTFLPMTNNCDSSLN